MAAWFSLHLALNLLWAIVALMLIYFGIDVYIRLRIAGEKPALSYSMLIVGGIFFALMQYHIWNDLSGSHSDLNWADHVVPIIVLAYAIYEYRRLVLRAEQEGS